MLARTADNLFWLARSMERADFIARTIEATLRLEYLPKSEGDKTAEWEGALNAAGAYDRLSSKRMASSTRRARSSSSPSTGRTRRRSATASRTRAPRAGRCARR